MKINNVKILSLLLVLVLTVWAVGATVFASDKGASASAPAQPVKEPGVTATPLAGDARETDKDETVYVLSGADGSVRQIIVSDLLKNPDGAATLQDISELTDIENVKGDETFTQNGSQLVWAANGSDICYRGTAQKDLPVTLRVSYSLDGTPIEPEALAGKSGRLTIRYDYENHETFTADVNGEPAELHVPFAAVTGLLLDGEHFSNVEVTNGRMLDDGARTVVVGMALPGLQADLGVDSDSFTLPEYLEISADVTDCQLGMSMTVVTNKLFTELDADKLNTPEELSESLSKLTDAMTQLMDGSDQLADGLDALLEQSAALQDGTNALSDGASQLKDGAQALETGASALSDGASRLSGGAAQLKDGASQLNTGLGQLSANSAALNSGAKQVFDSLLSAAEAQIRAAGLDIPKLTISNYAQVLNSLIASLDQNKVYQQALDAVTAAVEAQRATVQQAVTAAVREQVVPQVTAAVRDAVAVKVTEAVRAQVLPQVTAAVRNQVAAQVIPAATNGQFTLETWNQAVAAGLIDAQTQAAVEAAIDRQMQTEAVQSQISAAVEQQMQSAQVQAQISAATDQQMQSTEVQAQISAATDQQMQSQQVQALIAQTTEQKIQQLIAEAMAGDEVQAKLTQASEGAKQIVQLKASLDGYQSFYLGLNQYTAGVDQAAAGARRLNSGAASLSDGAKELAGGAKQLSDGTRTLRDGAAALSDGANQLRDGIPALLDGVTQLRDGARQLSDGIHQFDDEAVTKLIDAVDGDLDGLLARARALVNAARGYKNYSGLAEGAHGSVKFIYRTDEIESNDN